MGAGLSGALWSAPLSSMSQVLWGTLPGPGLQSWLSLPILTRWKGVTWVWKLGDSVQGVWGGHIRAHVKITHKESWNMIPPHPSA